MKVRESGIELLVFVTFYTYLNPSSVVHETVLTYGVLIFELIMDVHSAHQYNCNKIQLIF